MGRINQIQNMPLFPLIITTEGSSVNRIYLSVINLEGSLSFNNVIFGYSKSGTTARTLGISFGLYSLNGSSFSLANSASVSTNVPSGDLFSWISLATSTTQDITPGTWYFAYMHSTSGANVSFLYGKRHVISNSNLYNYAGPPFLGRYSATTNAFPSSVNTSEILKDFFEPDISSASAFHSPFIIVSA